MPLTEADVANESLRLAAIEWLVWNDGNGCYTDKDAIAEGFEPLTLNGALQLVHEILFRDRVQS